MVNYEFKLKSSKQYFLLLLVIFTLCFYSLFITPIHFFLKILLSLALTYYGMWLFLQESITSFKHLPTGKWQLQTQSNVYQAELCGDSFVSRMICSLRFRVPGRRKIMTCMVFKDSLDSKLYRRLMWTLFCCSQKLKTID